MKHLLNNNSIISSKSHYLLSDLLFKWFVILSLIVITVDRNEAKVMAQNKFCADHECKVPIASGKTTVMYQRSDEMSLSFQSDAKVIIYGKSDDEKHLDVEINGKRGFAPKNYILEEIVFHKNPKIVVKIDYNRENETQFNITDNKAENQSSDSVSDNQQNQTIAEDISVEETKIQEEEAQSSSQAKQSSDETNQSSEQTKVFSSLLFGEEIKDSEVVTPTNDGFTVIDGTTFINDDYVFEASPTVPPEPATATKTATISLNLDVEDIKSPDTSDGQSVNSNDSENSVKEETKVEEMKDSVVDQPIESPTETPQEALNADKMIEGVFKWMGLGGGDATEDVVNDKTPDDIGKETQNNEADVNVQNESLRLNDEKPENLTITQEISGEEAKQSSEETNSSEEAKQASEETKEPLPQPIAVEIENKEPINGSIDETVNDAQNETVETDLKDDIHVSENHEVLQNITIAEGISDGDTNQSSEEKQVVPSQPEASLTEDRESVTPTNDDIEKETQSDTKIEAQNEGLNENHESQENAMVVDEINTEESKQIFEGTKLFSSQSVEESEHKEIVTSTEEDVKNQSQNSETEVKVENESNEKQEDLTVSEEINAEQSKISEGVNVEEPKVPEEIEVEESRISEGANAEESKISEGVNVEEPKNPEEMNAEESKIPLVEAKDFSSQLFGEVVEDNLKASTPKEEFNVNYGQPIDSTENLVKEETVIDEKDSVEGINAIYSSPEVVDQSKNNEQEIHSEEVFKWMGLDGLNAFNVISDIIPDDIELVLKHFQISTHLVVFTSIIAFNWCLMKVLLSVLRSSKRETELREISCKAQRQLYYFEAEKEKLQNEIQREREKALLAEERMQTAEHKVIPLEKEFRKIKTERDQLQQRAISLESELESATEAGFELNKLLNDFLTSQKENVELNSSVDALQQQITKQAEIVAKYETTAKQKEKENAEYKEKFKKMNNEIERLKTVIKETEHNLAIVQSNNEELKVSKSELNSTLNTLQEEFISLQNKAENYVSKNDELLSDIQNFKKEIDSLNEQIVNKNLEIEAMKEILVNLKKPETGEEDDKETDSEKALNDLYDIVKIQSELKNVQMEKDNLNSKLEHLTNESKQLNERLLKIEEENKSLKTEKEDALQEKMKAKMELEVLSKYYKEKELELGKEIGVQQIQRKQREEDASSLANQLMSLEEENISYKSQLQSMKKEIEETERKYKSQINQLEKQVHENWIAARNAERKLEESKAEASVLRQTLTMSVKSPVDGFSGDISYLDDSASSVSSLHDQFGAALPPPPPPPPPALLHGFNPLMAGMHLPFNDESDPSALWNSGMGSMGVGPHLQHVQMPNNFTPIQTDNSMSNNPHASYSLANQSSHALTYVPPIQQQWDSSSNRDTFSPSSHRSNSSPHPTYNMYSQSVIPQSHYSNPMSMSMSSSNPMSISNSNPMSISSSNSMSISNSNPMMAMSTPLTYTMNSMTGHYSSSMTTVLSPLVNSSPSVNSAPEPVSVLSNPIPSHWMRPNGNVANFDYSQTDYNGSNNTSRPASRNDSNSLHTSIV